MPLAADQFRSSDVTFWGLVALGCWGTAMLLAGIGGLLPGNVMAGLHASRLDGANLNQLRAEIAELTTATAQLRRDAAQLAQRLDLQNQAQADVTRRVGALEVTIPALAERAPDAVAVDPSVTASVVEGRAISFDADGGTVTVAMRPLPAPPPGPLLADDVIETAPAADGSQPGVALGFPIEPEDGGVIWESLMARVGTLLLGLTPVLAPAEDGEGAVIVAGPMPSEELASELCDRLSRVGIPCASRPFAGEPLPLLN